MELNRTIHSVGQGGFYTESLKDDNGKEFMVVYDCGGNNKQFMENYLDSFIQKSPNGEKMVIDAVFISHLHTDHINGVKYLLENTNVRYLFLPQLTPDMLIEVLLYNKLHVNANDDQNLTNFILSIYGNQSEEKQSNYRIVQVRPATNNDKITLEDHGINLDNNIQDTIDSGTKISLSNTFNKWLYIPYNPPVREYQNEPFSFSEYLKQNLGIPNLQPKKVSNIVEYYGIDKLRKLYKDYFGSNHNSYSMTLFSGLRIDDCYHSFLSHRRYKSYRWCNAMMMCVRKKFDSPNCLYTGDFEPLNNVSGLQTYYKDLWETIALIQVPHHGSRENYHHSLYDYACRAFVSVGTRNRYHHPNIDTLINIHRKGCWPIVVTDDFSTMYVDYYK